MKLPNLLFSRKVFFCLAVVAVFIFGQSSVCQAQQRLEIKVPIDAEIAAEETKTFTVHLDLGQFAVIELQQKSVDLVMAVDDAKAGGERLHEINSYDSLFGSERVFVTSPSAEPRDFLIRVFPAEKKQGKFSIILAEQKAIDEQSQLRLAAQTTIKEAQKAYSENKAESRQKGSAFLEDALKIAHQSGDEILERDILAFLQSVSFHLGDYSKSLEYGEKALKLPISQQDTPERLQIRTVLGLTLVNRNEVKQGIAILSETAKEAEKNGDGALQATSLLHIGEGYQALGDLAKSLHYAEQGKQAAERVGNIDYQIDASRMMARVYFVRGDFPKSVEVLTKTLPLKQDLNTRYVTFHDLGLSLTSLGQYQKALDYLQEALNFYQKADGNKWNEAAILLQISSIYSNLGQYETALEYSRQASEIYEKFNYKSGLLGLARARAANYRKLGDYEKEKQEHLDVIRIAGDEGSQQMKSAAYLNLANIERIAGNYDAALDYYAKSQQMNEAMGDKLLWTRTANETSGVYIMTKQFDKAAELSKAVMDAARLSGDRVMESNALYDLARIKRSQNDLSEARKFIEESLTIIESVRAELIGQESRAGYFSTVRNNYDFYIQILVELQNQTGNNEFGALAYAASERARARSLLDLLAESQIDVASGIDPELKQRERASDAKISTLQARLIRLKSAVKPDELRIADTEREIKKTDVERQQQELEIRRSNPRYAQLKYPTTLNLAATQKILDEKTVLLEYQTGANGSYLFAVGRNEFQVVTLPGEKELREKIKTLRRSITTPSRTGVANYLVIGNQLYEQLIAPAAKLLKNKTRIIVAADGALNYLPFEVLLTNERQASFDKLSYLVRDFDISYTPSASVLANLKNQKSETLSKSQKDFLAFAAPDYSAKSENQPVVARPVKLTSVGDIRNLKFADLHHAKAEAENIAKIFPSGRATVYTGDEATEERAATSELLSQYRYVHFAVHGLIDESQPQFSSLVLTLPKADNENTKQSLKLDENSKSKIQNPRSEDGLLQMREIFNLRLQADLVTLSACETGLGKELLGEGIVGLTRAFFYAGTPSLVVSLWKVDDASSSELMTAFYENLRQNGGRDKSAALRQAQLKLINGNRYAHPYYWAPFILQGKTDSIVQDK